MPPPDIYRMLGDKGATCASRGYANLDSPAECNEAIATFNAPACRTGYCYEANATLEDSPYYTGGCSTGCRNVNGAGSPYYFCASFNVKGVNVGIDGTSDTRLQAWHTLTALSGDLTLTTPVPGTSTIAGLNPA